MFERRRWAWMVCLTLVVLCSQLVAMAAGPPLTLIQDTLYKADGSRFNGTAFIYWKSFEAVDSSNVPMQSLAVRIVNGSIRVQLVPTTNASTGAYYQVVYNSNGRTQFTEYWSVPPSAFALHLKDVRIQGPLGASDVTPPVNTAILIPDISGLREELDARPVKGTGYSISRAAIINASGEMESALGDPSDCVHVDGTSGACGSIGGSGGGSSVTYADSEVPGGTIDGTNGIFTLAASPAPALSLQLYRNGLLLAQNADYTLTNNSITLAPTSIPEPGDSLVASYRITTNSPAVQFSDAERPAGAINSVNTTFALQSAPNPASSLIVFRNGVLQESGVDYNLSGATLTFNGVSTPQTGDTLQAFYRF